MTSGHSIEYEICDLYFTVATSSWPHEICTGDIWHAGHCSSVPHKAGEPGSGYGTSHRLRWTKAGRVRQTWNLPWPRELIQSIAMWSDRHAVYIRCVQRPESNTRCSPFIFWDRVLWTLLELTLAGLTDEPGSCRSLQSLPSPLGLELRSASLS